MSEKILSLSLLLLYGIKSTLLLTGKRSCRVCVTYDFCDVKIFILLTFFSWGWGGVGGWGGPDCVSDGLCCIQNCESDFVHLRFGD